MFQKERVLSHRLWTTEQKDSEPWYWGYMFQGGVILGVAPILIPILVAQSKGASAVGLVVGAFYLGQVLSPVIGKIADKTRRFAWFYLGGFALIGIGCAGFILVESTALWILFAGLQGLGAGSSNTTAFSYIVEFRPKEEWDARLGWLQTFYGSGQAVGLLLAALLQSNAAWGMILCAVLMIPGVLLARRGLPKAGPEKEDVLQRTPETYHVPSPGPARTPVSIARHHEHLSMGTLLRLKSEIFSAFSLWIACWFLLMVGVWLVMNFIPLLMQQSYGISAGLSSLYYGITATIGIFFYAPSGAWAERWGSERVVFAGALAQLVACGGMVLLIPAGAAWQAWLVPVFFGFLPIAWSPLIVGGSALAGELARFSQGEAMGIFNATMALASVAAAVVGGWIAATWSYDQVTQAAAVFSVMGLIPLIPLLFMKLKS